MRSPDPHLVDVIVARQIIHSLIAHMMPPSGPAIQVTIANQTERNHSSYLVMKVLVTVTNGSCFLGNHTREV